jgi:hypothetical protein
LLCILLLCILFRFILFLYILFLATFTMNPGTPLPTAGPFACGTNAAPCDAQDTG